MIRKGVAVVIAAALGTSVGYALGFVLFLLTSAC